MYAVGQGALAVECREDDSNTLALLSPLSHRNTVIATVAERALMRTLEGGCSAPVAVHAKVITHLFIYLSILFIYNFSFCVCMHACMH